MADHIQSPVAQALPVLADDHIDAVLMAIDDRDALYNALLVHGHVFMKSGKIHAKDAIGQQWTERKKTRSSVKTGLVGVSAGQIGPTFADRYFQLMLRDIRKLDMSPTPLSPARSRYSFTAFGRDIWVRLCGSSTLNLLLANPGITRIVMGHVWDVNLPSFSKFFVPTEHNYSRLWTIITGVVSTKRLAYDEYVHSYPSKPIEQCGRGFTRYTAPGYHTKDIPYIMWIQSMDRRTLRDISILTQELSELMDKVRDEHNVENVAYSDLLTFECVRVLVDLMLRYNEYMIRRRIPTALFDVATVCYFISRAYEYPQNIGPHHFRYVKPVRPFIIPWDKINELLFSPETQFYSRMMKYLRMPHIDAVGGTHAVGAEEITVGPDYIANLFAIPFMANAIWKYPTVNPSPDENRYIAAMCRAIRNSFAWYAKGGYGVYTEAGESSSSAMNADSHGLREAARQADHDAKMFLERFEADSRALEGV